MASGSIFRVFPEAIALYEARFNSLILEQNQAIKHFTADDYVHVVACVFAVKISYIEVG
jgi:hypothetical protein